MTDAATHWERVYTETASDEVSWFEPTPRTSVELIGEAGIGKDVPIVDVGGGESHLAGELLDLGYTDVTVADISATALKVARAELGRKAREVHWDNADLLDHDFGRRFGLWHDRAVFHFLVEPTTRDAYLEAMRRGLAPDGQLVIATFGPQGPTRCSGLPVQRYGAESLVGLLPDFELASSRIVQHRTPGGNKQQFQYARFMRRADQPAV
ncbi:MAG TPA: class I SAM-dependent methyltransferase [Solirubrobacterales bacterium]